MFTGIVAVVIGLGFMILVHEWGHFIVARLFGVRVDVFSIGFGTRLWGVKRGPTDYRISALPLGGYVRMAGDNPAEERTGAPDEFLSKPRWQRCLIALAGPTMNFLTAVVITALLFMHGNELPSYADEVAVIAGVMNNSPAQQAGIQSGDRILALGNIKNPTWDRINLELALTTPGKMVSVEVERNGQIIDLTVKSEPQPLEVVGYPQEPVIIGAVSKGLPAEKAGLQAGDIVTGVEGNPLLSPYQFSQLVQQSAGKPLNLQVLRMGQTLTLPIQPIFGDPGDGNARWEIGIAFRFATTVQSYSLPAAIAKSSEYNLVITNKLIYMVGQLVTLKVSAKQLEGPLGIVQASSQAAKVGFGALLTLMSMISLNLGILNLLPIPILDGGHIFMLGVEGLLRHDLSLRIKERVVTAGMVFLIAVFLFVMYNDVMRLFPAVQAHFPNH